MDNLRCNHLHTKPSNFALGPSVGTQSNIRRFCMEMIGLKSTYIPNTSCNKEFLFGEWMPFMTFFPNTLSHPLISQILIFLRHHIYHSMDGKVANGLNLEKLGQTLSLSFNDNYVFKNHQKNIVIIKWLVLPDKIYLISLHSFTQGFFVWARALCNDSGTESTYTIKLSVTLLKPL